MPDQRTIQRARKKRKQGRSPGTQAGEFVRTEMEHIRAGKHGARNTKQAIAIGLSKARRAGVPLPPPPSGTASAEKEKRAGTRKISPSGRRNIARARERVMRQEGSYAASPSALRRQAKQTARRRGPAARHRAAMKAVRTKGPAERRQAAQKAARTRARRRAAS